jgi:predicted GIY-YIG superfamily endonuclease
MGPHKTCVYILQSQPSPHRHYKGLTSDVAARLAAHNAGCSNHTANGRPWRLVVVVEFADAAKAEDFEQYLKSGSGRAFAQRHFR